MDKIKVKELFVRVIILFAGLSIAHFGVTLFILADLGSDPFNVMIQGLYRTICKAVNIPWLTHGRVHMVMSFLIILVLFFVDKTYIKIGTIICMVAGGPLIDLYSIILEPLFAGGVSLVIRILVNCLGCVILAFGMTIVIKSEAGTGPNDLVGIVLSDKLHKKFSMVRVIVDVCFVLIGVIMGGTIGIGTVICAFIVGPVAGYFLPISEKLVKKFV